ncbi:MAG TPA: helix-turn-helix transcriptional regulator [Ktedonobacteraceae bacterium]|nr:helix-turn-helix transcriptional regulator [Ktedonobacteraceae bacterium]
MARVSDSMYHHGTTIKEFRLLRGMTQEDLAALWPRSSGGVGVLPRYIQDIEYGKKHVDDPATLRQLATLLHIPLWRFGLSEYDPFHPQDLPGHGKSLHHETLDTVECLIQQAWNLRCAARLVDAEKCITRLNSLFTYFHENIPLPLRLETRFQLLYAQVQRLNAVTSLEQQLYDEALDTYGRMYETAKQVNDASLLALSLMSQGTEFERRGEKNVALSRLENARDISFSASKHIIAFVHTYLARVYASLGDKLRFERAIHSARTMANSFNMNYGDGTQFVFGRVSSILAESSYGYLELGEPQKTLDLRTEIEPQIRSDQDVRLETWIHLDWARAYQMLGQVEESINEGQTFYRRAAAMRSPHAISQAKKLLRSLEKNGYANIHAVQDFREQLQPVGAAHN